MKMKNKQRDILAKVKNHDAQFISWEDDVATYEITEVAEDSLLKGEEGKVTTIIEVKFTPDKNHTWEDFKLLKEHKVWVLLSKEGLKLVSMQLTII